MLKNSKIGYNWLIKIIIGYYNWIFLIYVVLSLVFFCFLFFFFCFLDLEATEFYMIFQRVIYTVYQTIYMDYYIWAIAGHELGALIIRVHNSLTVHNNFDNFS